MQPGRRRAQGIDLDSIGPYVPGDDLRSMDWRATARTGRAQMKRFLAESHRGQMLVIDFRSHMYFATNHYPMAKMAALMAARDAWLALSLHEPIGLVIVSELEVVPPRRNRGQVLRILDRIAKSYERLRNTRSHGGNDALAEALSAAAAQVGRGDEISVYSDFGGPLDGLATVARGLAATRTLRAVPIEDEIFSAPSGQAGIPCNRPELTSGRPLWSPPIPPPASFRR
jgi:uncharacterized protein (DUF58 family)